MSLVKRPTRKPGQREGGGVGGRQALKWNPVRVEERLFQRLQLLQALVLHKNEESSTATSAKAS